MKHYTLAELEALPILATGQADDLKIDTEDTRVWISRCGVEDGEPYPNKVTVEKLQHYSRHSGGGYGQKMHESVRWVVVEEYQAI
jgi:hypothetical protein